MCLVIALERFSAAYSWVVKASRLRISSFKSRGTCCEIRLSFISFHRVVHSFLINWRANHPIWDLDRLIIIALQQLSLSLANLLIYPMILLWTRFLLRLDICKINAYRGVRPSLSWNLIFYTILSNLYIFLTSSQLVPLFSLLRKFTNDNICALNIAMSGRGLDRVLLWLVPYLKIPAYKLFARLSFANTHCENLMLINL